MAEMTAELDPGIEIHRIATELGFASEHHTVFDGRNEEEHFHGSGKFIVSRVLCAPREATFEPDELNRHMVSLLPTADYSFHKSKVRAYPNCLELPIAFFEQQIGTRAARSELRIDGEESVVSDRTLPVMAASRLILLPDHSFFHLIGSDSSQTGTYLRKQDIPKGTPQRTAYNAVRKAHLSLYQRMHASLW